MWTKETSHRTSLNEYQRAAQTHRRRSLFPVFLGLSALVVGALFVLFPLDWSRAPAVNVAEGQVVFSPNGDRNRDVATVIYSLSDEAAVTVQVLDMQGAVLRTLLRDLSQAPGQHTVLWDGRDERGNVVPDGEYIIQVQAQGSVRSTRSSTAVSVDTQPPIIRLANIPEVLKVREEELVIEGATEPGAMLHLSGQAQPIPVDETGGFRMSYHLRDGENRIELVATDQAGNTSSIVRTVYLLRVPPDILVENPPDGVWVNQPLLSVQGQVPPGTRVQVNGREAVTDQDGKFYVEVLLSEGENIVRITAVDEVGNQAETERRVILKTKPPPVTLLTVREGMVTHEPSLLVMGQTEPHALVLVNNQRVVVDNQGGFQTLINLMPGTNLVRVESVDLAGNSNILTYKVRYQPTEPSRLAPLSRFLDKGRLAVLGGLGVIGTLALLVILAARPLSLSIMVDPPIITPAGLDTRPAVVRLELSRPAQVSVMVWDQNDEACAVLCRGRRYSAGEHFLVWDGFCLDGSIAAPGTYEIEAVANTMLASAAGSVYLQVQLPALASATTVRVEDITDVTEGSVTELS